MTTENLISIIVAAHDEAAVIGSCLIAIGAQRDAPPYEIIVAANGCSDATVEVARGHRGVTVLDLPQPGKTAALNAADRAAHGFRRVYLDADILLPPDYLAQLDRALPPQGPPRAAVPHRHLQLTGRPWPIRSYFAINQRLPAYHSGLFGRGVIALSGRGRTRFERFPDVIADDLFLDSIFDDSEKLRLDTTVEVATPQRTGQLINRLSRVRRGNTDLRRAGSDDQLPVSVRPADRWAWLRDVVLPEPRLAPAGAVYAAVTVIAAVLARRAAAGTAWNSGDR
ncbi:glycosyltransferase [Microlunatus sp. GCM10028923]|uniref:glycosyltransferase n=1 Tax=Microlunatus sp. GCM10028923 TaxID=3273400 RepID=UPI00360BA173